MTFALAPDALTDAELLRLVRAGDPEAAARLWVRHWPTALAASRQMVETAEVPGLAAEALIGTLAMTALGSGPDDDLTGFVTSAVVELGQDEPVPSTTAKLQPDVYPSVALGQAFALLAVEDQQLLWADLVDGRSDTAIAHDLGVRPDEVVMLRDEALELLAGNYCRRHASAGGTPECVDAHTFLAAAATGRGTQIPNESWVHLSECAACTEAFHELAHTSVALGALLGPTADPGLVGTAGADAGAAVDHDAPAVDMLPVSLVPASVPVSTDDPGPGVTEETMEVFPALVPPAAVLDDPGAEPEKHAPSRRRAAGAMSRWRVPAVVAVVVLAVLGVGAVAMGLTGGDDPAPSARVQPTDDPTDGVTATPDASVDPQIPDAPPPTATVSGYPTTSLTQAVASATAAASGKPTSAATKPAGKPTSANPGSNSGPTAAPSTSAPADPEPSAPPAEPTPTATPTQPCQFLPRLIGMCK